MKIIYKLRGEWVSKEYKLKSCFSAGFYILFVVDCHIVRTLSFVTLGIFCPQYFDKRHTANCFKIELYIMKPPNDRQCLFISDQNIASLMKSSSNELDWKRKGIKPQMKMSKLNRFPVFLFSLNIWQKAEKTPFCFSSICAENLLHV